MWLRKEKCASGWEAHFAKSSGRKAQIDSLIQLASDALGAAPARFEIT